MNEPFPHSIPAMSLSSIPNLSLAPKTCSETPKTATRELPEMAKEGAKGSCFLQEAIKKPLANKTRTQTGQRSRMADTSSMHPADFWLGRMLSGCSGQSQGLIGFKAEFQLHVRILQF